MFYNKLMFFLPKCYKRLEWKFFKLETVGGVRKTLKVSIGFSRLTEKRKKNSFLFFLNAYSFSHHDPSLLFVNRICNRLTSVVHGTIV